MKKNKRNSNLLQKLKPNVQSKKAEEENSKGFEWLYTRSWAKGLGRRHGMMGAWCGASSSLDLVAQVCQPPALRPRRRHLDGRWKRTVIDVRCRRVDDPDERCPPVAHRLSRLGHDEFREPATRNAVELGRASASRRWPGVWRGRRRPVAPVLGRRDALPGMHTSMPVDGRERMGLDGRESIRRFLIVRLWYINCNTVLLEIIFLLYSIS